MTKEPPIQNGVVIKGVAMSRVTFRTWPIRGTVGPVVEGENPVLDHNTIEAAIRGGRPQTQATIIQRGIDRHKSRIRTLREDIQAIEERAKKPKSGAPPRELFMEEEIKVIGKMQEMYTQFAQLRVLYISRLEGLARPLKLQEQDRLAVMELDRNAAVLSALIARRKSRETARNLKSAKREKD